MRVIALTRIGLLVAWATAGGAMAKAEDAGTAAAPAADCSQWGGSSTRNNTPDAKNVPVEWTVGQFDNKTNEWIKGSGKGVRWVVRLGNQTYGTPVVAGGKVFCATNNGAGYLARYPADVDLGCLLAFDAKDGRFLWQLSREKLKAGRSLDWPDQGICCSPLVEGNRLWTVTNRGEVVCLDTEGLVAAGGKNQGPYRDEPNRGPGEADIVWIFDMMKEVGSLQHNMASCSVTAVGDLLMVNTSNGVDESHEKVAAPEAPSFIALDKRTGRLVWADNSPGGNILHGQWGSPAAATLGGVPQVIFPGGDGWLYSFLATAENERGRPKLLWKFDCNAKDSKWENNGRGNRNELIATPVICDGRVYLATGQDPEYGEGPALLWCIDPTKRGDVSRDLVLDKRGQPVGPRRLQALDKADGDQLRRNPNSAAVWCYAGRDANGDGKPEFEEVMHRSLSLAAVQDGLVVIADFAGLVHCLDAKTGRPHWTHDMLATIWGSPLIADGKIYIADEDGDVAVFELAAKKKLLAENNMGAAVYSAPVVAGGVLYISSRDHLFAIAPGGK
jgi:outer membrane protein assembly factor BamB